MCKVGRARRARAALIYMLSLVETCVCVTMFTRYGRVRSIDETSDVDEDRLRVSPRERSRRSKFISLASARFCSGCCSEPARISGPSGPGTGVRRRASARRGADPTSGELWRRARAAVTIPAPLTGSFLASSNSFLVLTLRTSFLRPHGVRRCQTPRATHHGSPSSLHQWKCRHARRQSR